METLPIELLPLILPLDPENLGSLRLVSREWQKLVTQGTTTIHVPPGKGLRYSFLALFPHCTRVRGLVFPLDQEKDLALPRILSLQDSGLGVRSLDPVTIRMMNENLKSRTDRCTFHYRSVQSLVYGTYHKGRLSLELVWKPGNSEPESSQEFQETSPFELLFSEVPVEDVFMDSLVDTGDRISRSRCPFKDLLFSFFFRKKPHTLRFKGRRGERIWSSLIRHADWPLRIIRLQAYPPSLGIREAMEIPLLDEEGYAGVPEPPLSLFHPCCISSFVDPRPTVIEYRGPIEMWNLEEFLIYFPRLQTLYWIQPKESKISLEGLRIVNLQFTSADHQRYREEARARKGLPRVSVLDSYGFPKISSLGDERILWDSNSPIFSTTSNLEDYQPESITPSPEDPLETLLIQIQEEREQETRVEISTLQATLARKIREFSGEWPLIFPLERVNEGALSTLISRLTFRGLKVHRMWYVQDARGPEHSFHLEYTPSPPLCWWREYKQELHIYRG